MMLLAILCGTPLVTGTTVSGQAQTNPIEKVIEMMSELQQKIIKEGEAAQKVYDEFAEWCEEESKNLQFEIKTGKSEAEDLQSTIARWSRTSKLEKKQLRNLPRRLQQ